MESDALTRRDAVKRLAMTLAAPAVLRRRYRLLPWSRQEYSARAIALMERATAVDMLDQFRFPDYAEHPPKATLWLTRANTFTEADLAPYRDSHIRVLGLGEGADSYEDAIKTIAEWSGFAASYDQWFMRIDDAG